MISAWSPAAVALGRLQVLTVLALLFAGVIPWRRAVYFEGALDGVVVAKALLIVVALLVALLRRHVRRWVVPAAPVLLLTLYLSASLMGALTAGTLLPSAVVAVRVVLVAATLTVLIRTHGPEVVATAAFRLFMVGIAVAVLTGVDSLTSGRLRGGIPPLHPNELALLASACALWVVGKILRAEESPLDYGWVVLLLGVVYLTGSRTTLLAVVVAALLMLLRATRITRSGLALGLLSIPVLGYVFLSTDTVSSIVERGGSTNVTTLSNRTIAWQAAIDGLEGWEDLLFGRGLSVKRVSVPGQWWNTQILDSSWVSALVQAGVVGSAIVALWVVVNFVRALGSGSGQAALWVGWTSMLAVRSSLESGLFDASVAFIVWWLASLGGWWGIAHGASVDAHPESANRQRTVRA